MQQDQTHSKQLIKLLNKTLKDLLKGRITQSPLELASTSLLRFLPKNVAFAKYTSVSFIAKRIMLDYFILAMESDAVQIPSIAAALADDILSLTITTLKALYPHRQHEVDNCFDDNTTFKKFRAGISPMLSSEFMALMSNASYHHDVSEFMKHVITYERLLGYRRQNITLYYYEYLPAHAHQLNQLNSNKNSPSYLLTTALTKSYMEYIHRTQFIFPLRNKLMLLLMITECLVVPGLSKIEGVHIGLRLFSGLVNLIVFLKIAALFLRDLLVNRKLRYHEFHHFLSAGARIEEDVLPMPNHLSVKCRCCDCQRYSHHDQNLIVWRTMLRTYQNMPFINEIESLRITYKLAEPSNEIANESKKCFTETITTSLVTKQRGHHPKHEDESSEWSEHEESLISSRRDKSCENIVLPSGEKGSLIYGRNNRLMLIYNPDSSEKFNFEESSACGLREARAKGQGGYKYLRKNVGSIKFAGNQQREISSAYSVVVETTLILKLMEK